MQIQNRIIDELSNDFFDKILDGDIFIENCIIKKLECFSLTFRGSLTVRNCLIEEFRLITAFFDGGFSLKGNVVLSDADFQAIHNYKKMEVEGNVFHGFFKFFDCIFEAPLEVRDNVFLKGSDLLVKGDVDNSFYEGVIAENNIGTLDASNVVKNSDEEKNSN